MATLNRLFWANKQLISSCSRSCTLFKSFTTPLICTRNVSTTKLLFDETIIKMPALSPTMETGTIVKWHKKEGEKISAGDILCEVQTDKAVVAFEFDDDGILAKILVQEQTAEIKVGDLIAIVCGEDDDWKNVKVPDIQSASAPATESKEEKSTAPATAAATAPASAKINLDSMKIAPSARNMISHYGIDMSKVQSSGPKGVIMKEDVMKIISDQNLKPKDMKSEFAAAASADAIKSAKKPLLPSSPYIDIELTSMRKTIAKRLTESKSTIPHAYMSVKCFMDEVIKLRKYFKEQKLPVSINDMIVKATALALKQVPHMNCKWNESNEQIEYIQNIDVSIAVATPSGLITPIIPNANRLTLEEISNKSRELIQKAKENKLQPNEFIGGTFSISNLGMYDIDHFIGVINPPQAAILAVGSTRQKFFGDENDYKLQSQAIMTLSFDSRAIDEELAATFLENLQENLENASTVLMYSDGSNQRRLSSLIN